MSLLKKTSYLLESLGLILALSVLLLIQNAYSEFSKFEQINIQLIEYQHALRGDVMTVHLLVHELPKEAAQIAPWREQLESSFSRLSEDHAGIMQILAELQVNYDRDLHDSMMISLQNLEYFGRLMIKPEEAGFNARQVDEAFDQVYASVFALMEPHYRELKGIIGEERSLSRAHFEELMKTVVVLFVVVLGALAWYQHRVRRLHSRLQEQIRASQAVTENLVDGVLTMDSNGEILSANPMICRILGYGVDELVGHPIEMLMPLEHSGSHGKYVSKYVTTGVRKIIGVGRKLQARHKDGHLIPIYLGVSEYNFEGQRCFAGVMRDISKEMAYEQELLQARDLAEAGSRTKSEFLSAMTHEVRTPLNGIMGALSLLRMENEGLGYSQEYLDLAYNSSKDLLKLLEAVLEYSRMEQQQVELQPVAVQLRSFCRDLLATHKAATQKKQLTAQLQVADDVPDALQLDALRLRQVLDHLLSNAIKFTTQGGYTLEVTVRQGQRPCLYLTVSDSGEGIAPEHQQEIFLAFKQVDGSLTRRYGGMGLGLAICSRLTTALGGELTVESTLGKGSRFTLALPVEILPQKIVDSTPVARRA